MSSLLTVVGNPRRRRRKSARRRTRRTTNKSRTKRRRNRRVAAVLNPRPRRRRRRVGARRARRSNPRRRRHHNPMIGGGITKNLMKGLGVGAGMYGAEVLAAAVNGYFPNADGTPRLSGLAKTGVKALAGLVALPMLFKILPIPNGLKDSLINGAILGGGAIVGLDLLHQYATPMLPAQLHDGDTLKGYDYGTLSAYSQGMLSGWAPQSNISGWAPQDNISGSDDAVYGGGAY